MEKFMILGAGIYQVPLILKAREMGLSPVVVSYPGPYPGFELADECLYLDTRDAESILAAAREKKIRGICTTGTDVAIRTLGHVAETLHLPGLSRHAAQVVTDKYLMRDALQKGKVSGAIPFLQAFTPEDALRFFREIGGPIMVKAVDSSGSRGITRVDTQDELYSAYKAARMVSRFPYVLVEPYISGQEIGVDGFVSGGKLQLLLPHQKFVVTSGHTTLPGGHAFPYRADEAVLADIRQTIQQAVYTTGLDDCAFNADVMVSGGKAYILEIGGRCGATCIPELISLHCGFDYYRKMIENALGLHPDFSFQETTPCMAKLLFSPVDGVITGINQEALNLLHTFGYTFSLDYQTGDSVERVKNGTDRIGQLILKTDQESELDQILHRFYGAIEVNNLPLSVLWDANKCRN